MPKAEQSSAETLFHHWRRGDAAAGKAMAQRFNDWYYAISVSRLGDDAGEPAFRAACSKFSKGVAKVEDPRRLLSWAHGIARKQLTAHSASGRLPDANLPNGFTRRRNPKEILVEARAHLPEAMRQLERAYAGRGTPDDPLDLLKARTALKTWLRVHIDAPFRSTPGDPDPDRAPLPWYEAGLMTNESEESLFELYMLNEPDLCQDIAEFAHYAIALRGGLPNADSDAKPPRPKASLPDDVGQGEPPAAAPTAPAPQQIAPKSETSNAPFILIGLAALGTLIFLIYLAVQWMMNDG